MDEHEQERRVRYRLGVLRHAEEVSGSITATCRYYGISRPTFYKWRSRYEELGAAGLRDRPSAPLPRPDATHPEIVGTVVALRREHELEPANISQYLRRYHDIEMDDSDVSEILEASG